MKKRKNFNLGTWQFVCNTTTNNIALCNNNNNIYINVLYITTIHKYIIINYAVINMHFIRNYKKGKTNLGTWLK